MTAGMELVWWYCQLMTGSQTKMLCWCGHHFVLTHVVITSLSIGVQSIVSSMFVCLTVCLLAYLKNPVTELHKIFCTCYLWPLFGAALTTLRYVRYFQFCRWCFHIMEPVGPSQRQRYFSSHSPGVGTCRGQSCCLQFQACIWTCLWIAHHHRQRSSAALL